MAFKFNPFTGNFDDVADVAEKVESSSGTTTDNAIARWDGTDGLTIQNSGVTIDDSDNVIIPGDLTVNGTTTTINTATLDVEDENITVNVNGNDASAEGAGLTIERTGTDGSFIYNDAATSKFLIGALGSEIEVTDISSSQTLTNKTIDADDNTILDIADANIAAAAAITLTKLAAVTADRAIVSNGSGFFTASAVTSTELGFLSGVTSAVQTQLDAKLDDFTSTTDNALIRSDGATGEAVQDSGVLLSDTDDMTALNSLTFNLGVLADRILDEDDLVSDSDTALATQQSIKAYVDASVAAGTFSVNSISTNTNAASNQTYLVDTSSPVQVTLPTPGLNVFVKIKDSTGNANTNNITVAPNAAEDIDGASSNVLLNSNFESAVFVSDGTNWFRF